MRRFQQINNCKQSRSMIHKFLTRFLFVIVVLTLGGGCKTSIKPGMVGIVFQKYGKVDPDGHFIVERGYKGIYREVLMPGTHFFWQTTLTLEIMQAPMTVIPEGKVGVLIAQDGRALPEGAILAEDDELDPETGRLITMGQKGIRKRLLTPGTYPINTEYLKVEVHDALNVEPGMVGVLIRRIGEPPPNGQILVSRDSPYRGIIKELVEPGTYYVHPKIYQWEIHGPLVIEPGTVGVLTRKIGDPPPEGQYLVSRDSPYRGIIKELLPPGMYYLHPKIYHWEIVDAITIPEGKIGVMTRKVGKLPPAGTILVERDSEYQGIIRELLEPGLYYMNPYEFDVQLADPVLIPDGFVGVMISKTGKSAPVDQLLVEEGFRGVRQDYLKPGHYNINPYEFEILPIATRPQTYEMRDELSFLSNDGFQISIDVTVRYEIHPENAPYIVATLGKNMNDIQTKIIRPGVRSFARLEGFLLQAADFADHKTRESFREKLVISLRQDANMVKVTIIEVIFNNYTLPEEVKKQVP